MICSDRHDLLQVWVAETTAVKAWSKFMDDVLSTQASQEEWPVTGNRFDLSDFEGDPWPVIATPPSTPTIYFYPSNALTDEILNRATVILAEYAHGYDAISTACSG